MKTIVYTGPGHVLVAGPHRIRRGVPTAISEQLFDQLQRDTSMTLTVVDPPRRRRKPPARKAGHKAATRRPRTPSSGEED